MEEDIEFQGIGKKMPYVAPDGFFEEVSEKTLQKAKEREQNHRKIRVLWRTVAVAASLVGIGLFGYYWVEPERAETKIVVVQEKQIESIQPILEIHEIAKQQVVAEIKNVAPEKTVEKVKIPESLNDVLADLSDEELLQLAAMYKTDQFINESEQ